MKEIFVTGIHSAVKAGQNLNCVIHSTVSAIVQVLICPWIT